MKPRVRTDILARLEAGERLCKHDVENCDQRSAQRALSKLHEQKLIHIVRWVSSYKQKIPVYALGIGRDAAKPRPISDRDRMRRMRKDPDYCLGELLKKRAKRLAASSRLRTPTRRDRVQASIAEPSI